MFILNYSYLSLCKVTSWESRIIAHEQGLVGLLSLVEKNTGIRNWTWNCFFYLFNARNRLNICICTHIEYQWITWMNVLHSNRNFTSGWQIIYSRFLSIFGSSVINIHGLKEHEIGEFTPFITFNRIKGNR